MSFQANLADRKSPERQTAGGFRQSIPAAVWISLATFMVYAIITDGVSTGANCETQLALRMLHGSFALGSNWGTNEVARANGQIYMVYGPGPSLLLLPLVAIFGASLNQTLVSAAFGAIAAGFWWAFLGRSGVAPVSRRWLTLLFAVGTPFAYSAAYNGNNWFIGTSTAVMVMMAALYAQACDRPFVAGLLMGMAPLSRYPTLLLAPAIAMYGVVKQAESWRDIQWNWRKLGAFALGMAVPMAFLCYYNWARFGSLTSEGYKSLLARDPADDYGRLPEFGLRYLHHNVTHYLFAPPVFIDKFPWIIPGQFGMSMLLATPIYFLLPWANWRKPANQLAIACSAAVLGVYWLYFTDGVVQFGMRYTVDFLPMVLLIVASQTASRFGNWARLLTLLGIAVEIWGIASWRLMGWL